MVIHARRALVGDAIQDHVAIELAAGGRIAAVRPARSGDPSPEPGLVVPGLVNAHLHLELSWAAGAIPGGAGLFPWVGRLAGTAAPSNARELAQAAATHLVERGTALVSDVSNDGTTGPLLAAVGLAGIVQHEHLGMHGPSRAQRVAAARAREPRHDGEVVTRPSPHAVYSTPPELLDATAAPRGGVVGSLHVAEDRAEAEFLERGAGPLARWMDEVGIDWSWYEPPGLTPVGVLEARGWLGPDLLLVHGVHLTAADRASMAHSGSALCVCARSNLHIGGQLPDVDALREAGVPLCLGTDSLASSPDLDVLGEVACWIRERPEVPALQWLVAATAGGADALRWPGVGRIEPGSRPGLLLLEGVDHPAALRDPPPRRWLFRRT